jgi:hypothetical protein
MGIIPPDRATLGSDPSALMVAYSIGRYHSMVPPTYVIMLVPIKR